MKEVIMLRTLGFKSFRPGEQTWHIRQTNVPSVAEGSKKVNSIVVNVSTILESTNGFTHKPGYPSLTPFRGVKF